MGASVKTAVVTGANGFLGAELVKQLLDKGFTVRATVRSAQPEKVETLQTLAAALPGKLEIVEGADLSVDGSFDKAVDGATYVFHVATPVVFGTGNAAEDQKSVIDPAVQGTLTVLRSVSKTSSVKRVVLTSSIVAMHTINEIHPSGGPWSDEDWNTLNELPLSEEYSPFLPYIVSKVQAEKAGWEFAKERNIDLVTILPSCIVGPVLNTRSGHSVDRVKKLLEGVSFEEAVNIVQIIDVRDAAAAHILAAENPSASGRYILSHKDTADRKEIAAALATEFPMIAFGAVESSPVQPYYDTSRVEKDLGLKLIPATTSFVDAARTLLALGSGTPAYRN